MAEVEAHTILIGRQPCVVLSDGDTVVIITDTAQPQGLSHLAANPILRRVTIARLQGIIEMLEDLPEVAHV